MAGVAWYLRDEVGKLEKFVEKIRAFTNDMDQFEDDLYDLMDEIHKLYNDFEWKFEKDLDYNKDNGKYIYIDEGWKDIVELLGGDKHKIGTDLQPPGSWLFFGSQKLNENFYYTPPNQVKEIYDFLKNREPKQNTWHEDVKSFYQFASESKEGILGSVWF